MDENVGQLTYEEYRKIEEQYMQPQKVPGECSFWMIRSKRGVFYDEYLKNGYIAIGWNALLKRDFSLDSEEQRKAKIAIAYPGEQRPSGCVNKCRRFIEEMKPGDIVVVVGGGRVAFCLVGNYYEEPIEKAVEKELEANVQLEDTNYKDFDIQCPYQKRRHIRCIREVPEYEVAPVLGKVILNRHSLSNLDEYATEVLSECFDLFEYRGKTYCVFRVTTRKRINAKALSRFFFYTTEALSGENDLDISTKTNLNSPGAIQFCVEAADFLQKNPLVFLTLTVLLFGGDIEIPGAKITVPSIRSAMKEYRERQHNKKMQTYEEKQAAANIEKTKAETAKLNAEAAKLNADAVQKLGGESIWTSEAAQMQYAKAIGSLEIAKPNFTKVDFSKDANLQKEDMGDSDEAKTPQIAQ